jgi:hypothetical protein
MNTSKVVAAIENLIREGVDTPRNRMLLEAAKVAGGKRVNGRARGNTLAQRASIKPKGRQYNPNGARERMRRQKQAAADN